MKASRWALAAAAALLLAGCGGGGGRPAWEGPPGPSADGRVEVSRFNEFLADERPASARSALLASAEFLRLDRVEAGTISLALRAGPEGGGPVTVVALLDRLPDDSIRSQRYVLRLERQHDGTWRLRSAVWAQRCWPGRGHQSFSPAPCV